MKKPFKNHSIKFKNSSCLLNSMKGRLARKEKIDFLLENKHYRQLHLILYLTSVISIVLIYFTTILLFSKFVNVVVTAIFSIVFGLALVFHRDKLVRKISNHLNDKKRKQYREENQKGLQTTIKKIGTRNRNLKFDVKGKLTLKEKAQKIKSKFYKKNKEQKDYIEIK